MVLQLGAEVKLQGLFIEDPDKALKIFEEEFGKALDQSSSLMLFEVDKRTPRGVTGDLAGSLFRERRGSGFDMFAIVATPLYYAKRVEEAIPYDPETAALFEWVKKKMGLEDRHAWAVTKVIKRNISARGQRVARLMFKKGFEAGRAKAQLILDKAAARIVERWS